MNHSLIQRTRQIVLDHREQLLAGQLTMAQVAKDAGVSRERVFQLCHSLGFIFARLCLVCGSARGPGRRYCLSCSYKVRRAGHRPRQAAAYRRKKLRALLGSRSAWTASRLVAV